MNILIVGQIWSANDQCKNQFGNDYSFCTDHYQSICTVLYCKNVNSTTCSGYYGAAEGTSCDSGKVIIKSIFKIINY